MYNDFVPLYLGVGYLKIFYFLYTHHWLHYLVEYFKILFEISCLNDKCICNKPLLVLLHM